MIALTQLICGLVILILGAEVTVRGSVALARNMGVPTLIIGLTIVALGTSAPEMVVSIQAVLQGMPALSLGNIIGSNIANILLALGLTAVIFPIAVSPRIFRRDTPWMAAATLGFCACLFGGPITRLYGAGLLILLASYLAVLFWKGLTEPKDDPLIAELWPSWKALVGIVVGLFGLVAGSDLLVVGASALASALGVSESLIGLTVAAVGTSAPEIFTCAMSAYRKHPDIALGNIVGSNLFNVTLVPGVAALVQPIEVAEVFTRYDVWILLGATALITAFVLTTRKIGRAQGVLLMGCYVAFTLWQIALGQGGSGS